MSGTSAIEWTDATWNPVRGCTKVSPGCDHCYAETFAERWRGIVGHPYEQGFDLRIVPHKLNDPLKWTEPRRVFVNSMSDLFQVDVPVEYIEQCWDVMRRCPQHTFQVLTKRAERMERLVSRIATLRHPLSNVWLGVSVESPTYYSRIRHLARTPAAMRFLSCEPLLTALPAIPLDGIGWVIVGGESGPGARAMDVEWARDIVRQCRDAAVPVFVKQLGRSFDGRKGNHIEAWPEDLRVREFPA